MPDILANAGGVVVSYFEWVQNLQRMAWDIDVVNAKLETIMKNAFEDVWQAANEKNTTMRMVCLYGGNWQIGQGKKD
ncbi:MAG: hypothetical protein ACFWUE_07470 [Xylanivirga thermophila]